MHAKNSSSQILSASRRSRGRTYVQLMCCLERVSQEAATRYPGVDHLRVCPDQPTPDLIARLARDLRTDATPSLADSFELWRQRAHDFDRAAADLDELRSGIERKAPADDRRKYQALLKARIQEVQRCRRRLEEATDHLEDELADELDRLL